MFPLQYPKERNGEGCIILIEIYSLMELRPDEIWWLFI